MSDEKIDRIDRRVNELVNITGNLVTAVTELTAQVKDNSEQIKAHSEQIKAQGKQIEKVAQQQQLTTNQLTDVARVVIETSNRVRNLEDKVDEGFEEFGKNSRVANRKIDWATNTSFDALTRVEDLESRVAQIEQKIAV